MALVAIPVRSGTGLMAWPESLHGVSSAQSRLVRWAPPSFLGAFSPTDLGEDTLHPTNA